MSRLADAVLWGVTGVAPGFTMNANHCILRYRFSAKVSLMQRLSALLFLLVLSSLPILSALAASDPGRMVQLVDYVGVDYPGAVADGVVVNAGEYAEMRDFAAAIQEQVRDLAGQAPELVNMAETLAAQVEQRAPPAQVAASATALRLALVDRFDIVTTPRRAPDLARARNLYAQHCAVCHGVDGQGDGPAATGLVPPPTDFQDAGRWGQRTLFGLYSTLSAGVDDTAMRGFIELSEAERWDLAFLVGRMAVTPQDAAAGSTVWQDGGAAADALGDLRTLLVTTPAEAEARFGTQGHALMAYLRSEPAALFEGSPLAYARRALTDSAAAYGQGQVEQAYRLAVDAYLEGFELIEQRLDAVDPELRRAIETEMTAYRSRVREAAPPAVVQAQAVRILDQLETAEARIQTTTLSGGTAYASALVILLREGLEAILVVAALAAFLIKTGRRDGLPYLHAGWVGALLLGGLTWFAAEHLIDISGSSREITEGVAALVAMAVLFYVGFWMHSKTSARQWQRFIQGSVQKALSTGTLWGLAGLAFIAVYREVFETILFYQALWVQADDAAHRSLLAGIGTAAALLVVLAWLILRYSQRLPLRQFFAVSGLFLFALAIVFAGKGIVALQEAGWLSTSPIPFPRIDWLGIYPNFEGLAMQGLLLSLALLVLWRTRRQPTA